jgi:xanthine dehydrogenase large subunit
MTVTRPLPHDSAPLHVAGAARYVDDIPLPADALHLAFGLSTVAHGEIIALDLSQVRAAPGVVLVLTAADLPHHNDVSPSPWHEPMLAEGTVHHLGQRCSWSPPPATTPPAKPPGWRASSTANCPRS